MEIISNLLSYRSKFFFIVSVANSYSPKLHIVDIFSLFPFFYRGAFVYLLSVVVLIVALLPDVVDFCKTKLLFKQDRRDELHHCLNRYEA